MRNPLPIALFIVLSVTAAYGAPKKNPSTNAVTQATNTVPELPKSVFAMPANPKEGRDPFYPNATSLYANPGLLNSAHSADAAFELLTLKSLSPTLAQINRTLMAVGEEADIEVPGGHIHVHLLQIKPESVIVEVGGQRRELHLRPGA